MPEYRQPFALGGTFFFALVTQNRRKILTSELARPPLWAAIATNDGGMVAAPGPAPVS
jgi:REP element-mobilizing transposase RayT